MLTWNGISERTRIRTCYSTHLKKSLTNWICQETTRLSSLSATTRKSKVIHPLLSSAKFLSSHIDKKELNHCMREVYIAKRIMCHQVGSSLSFVQHVLLDCLRARKFLSRPCQMTKDLYLGWQCGGDSGTSWCRLVPERGFILISEVLYNGNIEH